MRLLTEIPELLKSIRSGKSVALTGGAFDMFHIGHLKYLEEASKLADILIVYIDSDESVKRKKGLLRPIIKAEDRARIIQALQFVDLVVVGSDIYYGSDVLSVIRPDVVVKVLRQDVEEFKRERQKIEIKSILPEAEVVFIEEFSGVHTSTLIESITNPFENADPISQDVASLFDQARAVQLNGISFSGLKVGAALVADNGKIYTGCNLSNSSPTLALCAERVAIAKAISDGATSIKAILVYSAIDRVITPCGLCRQSIYELCSSGQPVMVYVADEHTVSVSDIARLLPAAFVSPRKV